MSHRFLDRIIGIVVFIAFAQIVAIWLPPLVAAHVLGSHPSTSSAAESESSFFFRQPSFMIQFTSFKSTICRPAPSNSWLLLPPHDLTPSRSERSRVSIIVNVVYATTEVQPAKTGRCHPNRKSVLSTLMHSNHGEPNGCPEEDDCHSENKDRDQNTFDWAQLQSHFSRLRLPKGRQSG